MEGLEFSRVWRCCCLRSRIVVPRESLLRNVMPLPPPCSIAMAPEPRCRSQPLRTMSSGLCVDARLCATAYEQVKLDGTQRKRRGGGGGEVRLFYHSNSNFLGIVKGRYLWQPHSFMLRVWEMVRDREAWRAAVHGVAKSRAWPSDFTFTFHFHALGKAMEPHSSTLAWKIP